jgi:phosphate acetyltransferase
MKRRQSRRLPGNSAVDPVINFIEKIKGELKGKEPVRIIFPEAEDERILAAVREIVKDKIVIPILVGRKEKLGRTIQEAGVAPEKIEMIDPDKSDRTENYAGDYSERRKLTPEISRKIFLNPLFFAAGAVRAGDVDGMIAGAVATSGEVIGVSREIIGLKPGISVPSSFFLMAVPGFAGGEDGKLIFADASVNPDPSAEELADIAIATGETAGKIFGWEPRIALLSFSTKGSAKHPLVDKIIRAGEIAEEKRPDFLIEAELQVDAALVLAIARRKMKDIGSVAGRANILIFPDLNSANIGYKLVNILAGAEALGPVLQGFVKPTSDLSRGAKPEEIAAVAVLLAREINQEKK